MKQDLGEKQVSMWEQVIKKIFNPENPVFFKNFFFCWQDRSIPNGFPSCHIMSAWGKLSKTSACDSIVCVLTHTYPHKSLLRKLIVILCLQLSICIVWSPEQFYSHSECEVSRVIHKLTEFMLLTAEDPLCIVKEQGNSAKQQNGALDIPLPFRFSSIFWHFVGNPSYLWKNWVIYTSLLPTQLTSISFAAIFFLLFLFCYFHIF